MNFDLIDSPLSKEAIGILKAGASESLIKHSLRSFFYAKTYAGKKKMSFDEEGLFLSAVFHDLGLCDSYKDKKNPFTFASSWALREFLEKQNVPEKRITPLTEAIDFHFQILPNWSKGPEAGLLQVGTWIDVTGLRRWAIWEDAKKIQKQFRGNFFYLGVPIHATQSIGSARSCIGLFLPSLYK